MGERKQLPRSRLRVHESQRMALGGARPTEAFEVPSGKVDPLDPSICANRRNLQILAFTRGSGGWPCPQVSGSAETSREAGRESS